MSILWGSNITILTCAFAPCGKQFQKNGKQRYCNRHCAQADFMRALRKRQAPVYEERICKLCSDPFIPKRKDQVFCHVDCSHLFFNIERQHKTAKEPKKCVKCGTDFIAFGKHTTYCTAKCRLAAIGRKLPKPKKCLHCHTVFQPRDRDNRFCQRKCYRNHHGRALPIEKERKCKQCGNVFEPKRINNRYCRAKCSRDWHNGQRAKRFQPQEQPEVSNECVS